MANNLYGGTLTLKDGYTSILKKFASSMNNAGDTLKKFTRESKNSATDTRKSWNNTFNSMNSSLNKFSNNTLSTIAKITAGWLSLKGIMGTTNQMFASGTEYQNSKVFLDAVYHGDGTEKYKFATDFANKTPFGQGEVANGLARAKSLGLGDTEADMNFYADLGSMAKITGSGDLTSAIDALSDASNGEWERLQTILGIKRTQLEEFAESKGMAKFTNKKGQVIDSEQVLKVIKAYMDDKGLTGLTEKYANTLQGRFDTLRDNFNQTLAEIGGIGEDGEIIDGSLFDQAGKGIERLIESLNKFGKSESFDKIQDLLGKMGNALINGFDYLTEHPELIDRIVKLGGAFIGLKVVTTIISPILKFTDGLGKLKNGIGTFVDFLKKTEIKTPKNNITDSDTNKGNMGDNLKNYGSLLTRTNLSKANSKLAQAGIVVGATSSLLKNDGVIHKIGNNINPMNLFNAATGKDQEDYLANIFGYSTKAVTWLANKTGQISDSEANYAYKSADQYMKDSDDYINNRTDTVPTMSNAGATIQVNIEKVEKEADMDTLIHKLSKIIGKFNDRNAVVY